MLAALRCANRPRRRPTRPHLWEVSPASMPRSTPTRRQPLLPSNKGTTSAVLYRLSMLRRRRRRKEESTRPEVNRGRVQTVRAPSKWPRSRLLQRSHCRETLPYQETRTGPADKAQDRQVLTGTRLRRCRQGQPAILVQPPTMRSYHQSQTHHPPRDLRQEAQWHQAPWDWEPVLEDRTANLFPRPSQVLMLKEGFNNRTPRTRKPWDDPVSPSPPNSPKSPVSPNSSNPRRARHRLNRATAEATATSDPTLLVTLDRSCWVETGPFSVVRTAANGPIRRAQTGSILQSACLTTCHSRVNPVLRSTQGRPGGPSHWVLARSGAVASQIRKLLARSQTGGFHSFLSHSH